MLAPVAFALVNAEGQGDFFGGIPPDCAAADDIEHDLGAADEASLARRCTFIRTGAAARRDDVARRRARRRAPHTRADRLAVAGQRALSAALGPCHE